MTHASMSSANRDDNQRLEFLGDRVLGLVMAEALLAVDLEASEGQLAPRFNALVRKETCADVAREIDLGHVLKLGRSEMISGGRRKQALLGDAIEAVIAAVYLDGGFEAAKALVLRLWGKRIDSGRGRRTRRKDRIAGVGAGAEVCATQIRTNCPQRAGPCSRSLPLRHSWKTGQRPAPPPPRNAPPNRLQPQCLLAQLETDT